MKESAITRRTLLERGTIATSLLITGGIAASGTAFAQGTDVKSIRCGQTKVGHISEEKDHDTDALGNVEDRYRFTLSDAADVTVTAVGHGPGFTKGQGTKGGQGQGEGQQESEPFVYLYHAGDEYPDPAIAAGLTFPGSWTTVVQAALAAGDYDIVVEDAAAVNGQNEPFKYQLTLECESP